MEAMDAAEAMQSRQRRRQSRQSRQSRQCSQGSAAKAVQPRQSIEAVQPRQSRRQASGQRRTDRYLTNRVGLVLKREFAQPMRNDRKRQGKAGCIDDGINQSNQPTTTQTQRFAR